MKPGVRKYSRRQMLAGGAALSAGLAFGGRGRAQSRESFSVGSASITLQYMPLYIAAKNGYLADNGLDVELLNTQSGPRTRQALAAGQILVGFSAVADVAALSIAGRPASLIYGIDRKMAWANILVRKDDYDSGRLRSLKDLSGLAVAVTQPQSAAWASMMELAANAKLEKPPIFQSLGDLASMLAALKAKRVDATMASVEMVAQAEADGWGVPIFSSADEAAWTEYLGGDTAGVGGYVLRRTIEEKPGVLKAFVAGLVKGTDFVLANPATIVADVVYKDYFASFERGSFEKAISYYQKSVYSKTNIVDEAEFARILKIFGGGRLFSEADAASPLLAYSQAVDMSFVKASRNL